MSQEKDLVTIIREHLSNSKQGNRENISQTDAIKNVPNMTGKENPKPASQPQTTQILNPASMRPKATRSKTPAQGINQ